MKDKRPTKRFAAPARAGRPLRPQQLLILAYAAAVIVWLVYVLVGSAVMLNHKADGTMVTRTLTADDLEFESFVNYDDDEWHTAPVDEPGWEMCIRDRLPAPRPDRVQRDPESFCPRERRKPVYL